MQACTNVQFIVSNYINAIISYCVTKNNIHTKNMSIILVNFYLQLYKKKINDWKKILGCFLTFTISVVQPPCFCRMALLDELL